MADLYAVLGIDPAEATMAALRRAWKRRMKETHPDMPGGDRAVFDLAQTALMVLSDPVKRERYDRTGEYDAEPPVDNEAAAVHELIGGCIGAVIGGEMPDSSLTRVDMVAKFRELLDQPRQQSREALKVNARARRRFEKWQGRFKDKTPETAYAKLIEGMIAYELAHLAEFDDSAKKVIERCDKAEEILASMVFEQEADEPANFRGCYFSNSTPRAY